MEQRQLVKTLLAEIISAQKGVSIWGIHITPQMMYELATKEVDKLSNQEIDEILQKIRRLTANVSTEHPYIGYVKENFELGG